MAITQIPDSAQELYNFLVANPDTAPLNILPLVLAEFSEETQEIINSAGNPFGVFALNESVTTASNLEYVQLILSNLLWSESQGPVLRKVLRNFGYRPVLATRTSLIYEFTITDALAFPATEIFEDESTPPRQYTPLVAFDEANAGTYTIELSASVAGAFPVIGIPQPVNTLANFTASSASVTSTTIGRNEETDEEIKDRLDNAQGAEIFGSAPYVEQTLLDQSTFVNAASVEYSSAITNTTLRGQNIDANSQLPIVRPQVSEAASVEAIGNTINNATISGQKFTQPPITDVPNSRRGVRISSGYANEAALNAAGYETDANSVWAVWTPPYAPGVINIPWVYAQPSNIIVRYDIRYITSTTSEEQESVENQIRLTTLQQTPIFSQTLTPINVRQYYDAIINGTEVDDTVEIRDRLG